MKVYTCPTCGGAQHPGQRCNNGGECPGCGLIMSVREAAEQGECNECHPGGAYDPSGGGAW